MATASEPRSTRAKPAARATATKKAPAKTTAKTTTSKKSTAKKTTAKKTATTKTTKTTTRKAVAKKTPAGASKHPFPFFGAGLASYFEWGGLYVWFEEPPPKAARAKLLKKIPEPFRGDAGWGGPVLHATSGDQFINLHICSAYARHGDAPDDDLEGYGVGQPFPSRAQASAFEADIVAWLHALHREHKIAFVARREDGEAGGTRKDAWHRWSMARFLDVVLPRWQAHHRKPPHRLVDWSLREALSLALDDARIAPAIPAAVRAWYAKD